jgi:cell volume regulation protein A
LTSGLLHLRPVLAPATALATVGTAIFGLLRGPTLSRKLAGTLEGESGFNDPVAVLLVIGFIDLLIHPGYSAAQPAPAVRPRARHRARRRRGRRRGRGPDPAAGAARHRRAVFGRIAHGRRARLRRRDTLHGSGLFAVYLAGLAIGSATIPSERTIVNFHQGLGWVAQVTMFLSLGLLAFPGQLPDVALKGTVLAAVLVLVARPIAVALATLPFDYSWRERTILGWAGLRGAVPVVLATFPIIEQVPQSIQFFNIVFFAVLLSTLVQGSTFEPIARRLGVTTPEPGGIVATG